MRGVFRTLLLSLYVYVCYGGYCTQTYSCPKTCYRTTDYTTSCGFWDQSRCTRYRQRGYTCYYTCSRQICCPGYTGSYCHQPICFGGTSCPNGGVCTAPGVCSCAVGFGGLRCDDINECETGTSNCDHNCANTFGSHVCSCRPGFRLLADERSCLDINECDVDNGGCPSPQVCLNEPGTFHCQCKPGYVFTPDKQSCVDEDECTSGTANCSHVCTNEVGSYRCSCKDGFVLSEDQHSCEDYDECTAKEYPCMQDCHNTIGAFVCSCLNGFELQSDGKTCVAINKCAVRNGGCDQRCKSEAGYQYCECYPGYRLNEDGFSCADIDECSEKLSGCEHGCNNSVGSFVCSCAQGFQLDSNNRTCVDEDDCLSVVCSNGGTCEDGISSYSCKCPNGYSGSNCHFDLDECQSFNGGCEEICTNLIGSYKCSCPAGRTLLPDGHTCSGGTQRQSVFEKFLLPRNHLPRGCHSLTLHTSVGGVSQPLTMLSTSPWYTRTSNTDVVVTDGVVMLAVGSASVPLSLEGVELDQSRSNSIIKQYKGRSFSDMVPIPTEVISETDCISGNLTYLDFYDFMQFGSFQNTIFNSLEATLPIWLSFGKANKIDRRKRELIQSDNLHLRKKRSILNVDNPDSRLILGSEIENINSCKGAPIKFDNIYSVFLLRSNFSVKIFDNTIFLNQFANGKEFCLINDISEPGSVFLLIPEESRDEFMKLDIFQTTHNATGILIKPRGIGLSLVKSVQVPSKHKDVTLWNGDHTFQYSIRREASVWLGGDVIYSSSDLKVSASIDTFLTVPDVQNMLIGITLQEWNLFITSKTSASYILTFELLEHTFELKFEDLLMINLDLYMSVGGSQPREWCGFSANPPGVFFSAKLRINPFKGVPILGDWIFYNEHNVYGFFMSNSENSINSSTDITNDMKKIKSAISRLHLQIESAIIRLSSSLMNSTNMLINNLSETMVRLENDIFEVLEKLSSDTNRMERTNKALTWIWKVFSDSEKLTLHILDNLEFDMENEIQDFRSLLKNEMGMIRNHIAVAIRKFQSQINKAIGKINAFGLKYRTKIHMFGVDIFGVDVEVVSSPGYLMRCSRFDTIRELLQGEDAFRFLGRIVVPQKLGRFITADYGRGVGGVISKSSNKKILHLNAYLSFLGISLTADLFITEKHLLTYIEGNVWNTFLAQLDIEAKSGRNWYELIYEVRGRFVARADRKRRQTQSQSKFFQASYFDAIKKVIQNTADWADQRISDAQDKLSQSEEKLTKAQKWFDEKKDDLRKANEVFDSTIKKLERVKGDFERAKEPYRRSLEKLTEAQRKVDNLCRIRSCRTFCIPGLKCKICYKGFFGIPYPCCRYTDCMISFPDPICVAKNVLCGVVRLAAFAALEAAKVFARAPMIVFDAAKAAVSIAQFAVDKSRVVLKLADGILQVAQLGLEAAKTTLRIAIVALEALKIAIGVAAQILQMVITYGVQNLVDVKNCGFRVQLSSFDLQAFEVGCDVNLFQLGWIPIKMKINFKNPIASLWSAAKATVDEVVKIFDISFGKRKRRDVTLHTSNKIVRALRRARAAGNDTDYFQLLNDTASLFNSSIDISNVTMGFEETSSNVDNSDYANRRSIFSSKCSIFNVHYKFLTDTIGTLSKLANDTKFSLDMVKGEAKWDKEYNVQVIAENITLANANISIDYAKNYNLTEEDLEEAMTDAKILMMNDEYLHDINRVASSSKATIQAEVDSVDINMFIDSWMMALENITGGHFNESDCVDFRDCLLHSLSTLYDLFSGDEQSDISEIEPILDEIADIIFSIVQNSTLSLDEMYNSTVYMKQTLARLNDHNIYCSEAPVFKSPLANVTIYEGGKAVFLCDVTAYPDSVVWWFKDNKVMDSAMSNRLEIVNTSLADIATYMCMAGNIVANLTSNVAYLLIVENIRNVTTCSIDNGGCAHVCHDRVGGVNCTCKNGYNIDEDDQTKCVDIDECAELGHGCEVCNNSEGSFICKCFDGNIFNEDTKSCVKGNDKCALIGLNCSNTSGCHEGEADELSCYCAEGFWMSSNKTECIDIDECEQSVCDHICTNTLGSYMCSCDVGYQLERSICVACEYPFWGPDCSNVCNCAAASSCDPVKGCLCEEGWQGENCDIDVDECQVYPNICNNTVQECFNEDGFYSCLCPEGYTEADNGSCVDIKECSEIETQCSQICNELEGSFSCDCYSGYYLGADNKTCLDIKECSEIPSPCSQICIEMMGSYQCACEDGFYLDDDNNSCTECHNNTFGHNCSHDCNCNPSHSYNQLQTCNTVTGICICNAQWTGITCDEDVNECLNGTICDQFKHTGCHNERGSFECDCLRGYSELKSGDCIKDTTKNNQQVSSRSKIEIRLTLRMEVAFPDDLNLNVSKTYIIVSENSKATIVNFFKGYTNDDFQVVIHDSRLGSLIVDFSLLMNNSGDSYQSMVRAAWVLLNGVSLHYANQSVAAKLVHRKQDIDQCLLRSELVGPCDDGEECVRDHHGPICRKKHPDTVVFLILGITITLVAVIIISCILRCKCRNRSPKFGEYNHLDLVRNGNFQRKENTG